LSLISHQRQLFNKNQFFYYQRGMRDSCVEEL
jgi:hypothetical protein